MQEKQKNYSFKELLCEKLLKPIFTNSDLYISESWKKEYCQNDTFGHTYQENSEKYP